ncbi:hypothetical protein KDH_62530 [Dictyobacter sp. S3.2.2.5]|uniref:Inorganic pyrophosphatase n=1 Tax=Dictyobacter halimunensis TaxID=3026934 RepID=A0ABQ6FYR0_9CHLR|nr:hypothetical protein KDH_62530 [Dictyobacter sp. S3.2.2.5]
MHDEAFWQLLTTLVETSTINIDRPRGSAHPRYPDVIYPLDYGYLSGTISGDGDGIDAWLGSQSERRISAILITVDLTKRDSEIKFLIGCTTQEQQAILTFHNRWANQSAIMVERPADI